MSQLPPAGWHPDPLGRMAQRYWDGQQWTEHVADQAGNMGTDPLDGGGHAQQEAQATSTAHSDTATSDWGGQGAGTSAGDWGGQGAGAWGQDPTATDTAAADTATTDAAPTDTGAWGAGDGQSTAAAIGAGTATGAAAATWGEQPAGGAATDTAAATDAAAASTATLDDTDSIAPVDAAGPAGPDDDGAWVGGVIPMEVDDDDPVVATAGAVVARQAGVTFAEREDGLHLAGNGTVWLSGGGRQVTVVTLADPGLTVARGALVAHSASLHREDAHPGIVGFSGVHLSGAGWVALAGAGGLVEVPTDGGVHVAAGPLVGFTNGIEVSHADTVNLTGPGVALVAGA